MTESAAMTDDGRVKYPLSNRTVRILEACLTATHEKPTLQVGFFQSHYLQEWGLIDFRAFDGETHGGFFITAAGIQALERHRASTGRAEAEDVG